MKFGLMFFGSEAMGQQPYQFLLETARLADQSGLCAIWIPERHFHNFGGLFPSPAVVGAALAAVTSHIRIRAGSLVAPLHDVIQIVEEFAVVDALSQGRVDVSFASGWHPNDFIIRPANYLNRRQITHALVEETRRVWRGESVVRPNAEGQPVSVRLYPQPCQPELPIWLTAAANPNTFRAAGKLGANVLTHVVGQDLETLYGNVAAYRATRVEAGHGPADGIVTVMLHTFIADDIETVVRVARAPFKRYMEHWMDLEQAARAVGNPAAPRLSDFSDDLIEQLHESTFRKYMNGLSLMGTLDHCRDLVARLEAHGINEIACLVDFGIAHQTILEGIQYLVKLARPDNS
ncbi:MAG TPA: MupA/Atu3671 family FMN-dependent luciferase-like monooxygenase [Candidatus Angelobacter sp.]|nr:MupA/Atu3671 family FMN-dependent luciferase-like monooxygenase [Candidatus Angelobacter sp.]